MTATRPGSSARVSPRSARRATLVSALWRSTALRFLAVGGTSTIFQLLLVALLVHLRVTPVLANALAFLTSTQLNFALSAAFTWRHRRQPGSIRSRWLRFNGAALVGLAVNSAAFAALHLWADLAPLWSAAGAALVSMGVSYVLSRLLVFTATPGAAAAAPARTLPLPQELLADPELLDPTPPAPDPEGASVTLPQPVDPPRRSLRPPARELLPPLHNARTVATPRQLAVMAAIVAVPLLLIPLLGLRSIVTAALAAITLLYLVDLGFNAWVVTGAARRQKRTTRVEEREYDWPLYTVLCPIYREAAVLPQFVKAMGDLDYPADRLQIMLLLEEDDLETQEAAAALRLPPHFEVLVLPDSLPKTKPKACNVGLLEARGEFTVIFDTEDVPEPDQLKKAVRRFRAAAGDLACVQAPLNFYNPRQNVLTRLFTAEYSLWFDLTLEGLQATRGPLPLGGTSNHFRTEVLVGLGGWDPYNVTEDADLGIRLYKQGFHTGMLRSTTYEEANPNLPNWIRQRSRWIKGYMQTLLVHSRGGWRRGDPHVLTFALLIGGKVAVNFINPIMWAVTIAYFAARPLVGAAIESVYPAPVFYGAAAALLLGNGLFIYTFLLGSAQRGNWDLVKYGLLAPLYWLAMSVAAVKALWQLITRPFYWEKTHHGLHLDAEPAAAQPAAASAAVALAEPEEDSDWGPLAALTATDTSRSTR